MIETKFLELFELDDQKHTKDPATLRQLLEEQNVLVSSWRQSLEQEKNEKKITQPKFQSAEYMNLASKAIEDLCANMVEHMEIDTIIAKIKRQQRADPHNKEYESLLKKSKVSIRNNLHQRKLIKTFILGLFEDVQSTMLLKNVG
jgi:DNA phosphorothioation-dependent restriction protein DptG